MDDGLKNVVSWGNLKGKNHFEDVGVDYRIILKRTLKQWTGWTWTD
jgi:hypothetical protein